MARLKLQQTRNPIQRSKCQQRAHQHELVKHKLSHVAHCRSSCFITRPLGGVLVECRISDLVAAQERKGQDYLDGRRFSPVCKSKPCTVR